ncbi:ribosomal protein S27AE [Thermoplasmatales archaeon SCGC AB-539-C06]|nr:ribosomal protein S27AE [Thermoplasmatales archaeon SCGC AB-539-C06]
MAKKQKKPKKPVKPHTLYETSGTEIKRKNKSCPKCGKGIFMAKHGNRTTCGKCGYTEFEGKKAEEVKETKPATKKEEKSTPKKEEAKK